jgi:hypothetical protein
LRRGYLDANLQFTLRGNDPSRLLVHDNPKCQVTNGFREFYRKVELGSINYHDMVLAILPSCSVVTYRSAADIL